MPVSASWHQELHISAADPFDAPERIEKVGVPVRLDAKDRLAELQADLFESVQEEAKLGARGIHCEIKDTDGTSCHVCPLFDADDPLCQIGRRQERLVTDIKVTYLGGRRE